MRAVCIGECMVELRPDGEGRYVRGFAGDAYNTAVYLKRTAPAAEVGFLTATGQGGLSGEMRDAWRAEGVGDGLAYAVPGAEPGLYLIELDARGERSFHYWRSASPARRWLSLLAADGGAERLAGADLVYLSGVSLAILPADERAGALDLLKALRGRVGRIAFDLNIRPALWGCLDEARAVLRAALPLADVVRASREDADMLLGPGAPAAQAAALAGFGAAEAVLTLDAAGCIVVAGGRTTAAPGAPARVVDTTGAGDCFNGAYLGRRMQGRAPEAAARFALAVAARKIGWPGAIAPAHLTHPPDADTSQEAAP